MTLEIKNSSKIINFEWDKERIQLLKDSFGKNLSDAEFDLFRYVCIRTGLDPFVKQIYPVKRKSKQSDGTWKDQMTIQTGIDGFRNISERTGRYSPGRESTFTYDSNGNLKSATSYIKKQTLDGTWHEVSATAFWDEYCQKNKEGNPTDFWKRMGHTMLAKCAEALAHRKAFPADLSGIYSEDEMAQSANVSVIEVTAEKTIEEPDLTMNELVKELESLGFLDEEQDVFISYIKSIQDVTKWSYRKCLTQFSKQPEKTQESFNNWKKKHNLAA